MMIYQFNAEKSTGETGANNSKFLRHFQKCLTYIFEENLENTVGR